MRIEIVQKPPITSIDGVRLDWYEVGEQYEVGNSIGALLLAEGWAAPVPLDAAAPYVPFGDDDPYDDRALYRRRPHVVKRSTSTSLPRDRAASFHRSKRSRRR